MATAPHASTPAPAAQSLKDLTQAMLAAEAKLRMGGGQTAIDRQHEKNRLTARERIALLVDQAPGAGHQALAKPGGAPASSPVPSAQPPVPFFQELGLWCAHDMYKEYGGAPAAGVVTGIGLVRGRRCMIIANDATVKAGAFFPMTCKKIIRAQQIAMMARLPLIYLVDSAGVFLPLQEDVFPDTDDFGRIFRHNAVISAMGIPQIAAIMGYCVAGGGYLPVLCDTLIMTEGSGLYLAGPALVKAAIGQEVTDEELGGASMHASISGTIDFKEKSDEDAITRVRSLMAKSPASMPRASSAASLPSSSQPFHAGETVLDVFTDKPGLQYDVRGIIEALVDCTVTPAGTGYPHAPRGASADGGTPLAERGGTQEHLAPDFDEYKADYGQSLVCGYAKIGGHACGIVANQKKLVMRTMPGGKAGPTRAVQMPAVIYDDSADKAARFIMDCNQRRIPIIFLHDTTGFMVGRDSEQGGIIKAGAKMVNAMANCVVPKIVVITGGSYGAGNYAMCGRAFDQFIAFAWPSAKCAVMGANQATGVLTQIEEASRKRKGETIDADAHAKIYGAIHAAYAEQAAITHAAARGWVDRMIEPHKTREELIAALEAANQGWDYSQEFKTGVLQV
jgi:acetyl-CoA carboxylase carboxyltransferase component